MWKKMSVLALLVCMMPILAVGCSNAFEPGSVPPANLVQQGAIPTNISREAVRSLLTPVMSNDTTTSLASYDDLDRYSFEDIGESAHTNPTVGGKKLVALLVAKYPNGKVYPVLARGTSPVLSSPDQSWVDLVLIVDTGIADGEGNRIQVINHVLPRRPQSGVK